MLPNQCFPNNYGPCRRVPWLFSERWFDPRVSDVQDSPELWVCEGRSWPLEWPAGRFIHLSWLTRPIFPPSPLPPPVRLSAPSSGTSSVRVKIRPVRSPRILLWSLSPRVYTWIIHVRYSCRYGPYETMIKRARAWRRVGRRIERLRCLEVADSMMVTFRRERRCFSRPAYLKRDPQTRRIINDPRGNPRGPAYFSSSTVHLFVPPDFVFVLILRNCSTLSSRT